MVKTQLFLVPLSKERKPPKTNTLNMKQQLTSLALAVLTLTLGACHTKDELPQPEQPKVEHPTRISAPFIGQQYTYVFAESDGSIQYSNFLELKDDGTIDYKRVADDRPDSPEIITGKYTYDPETKKIVFSDLHSSMTGAKTPRDLYFGSVSYDEHEDGIVLRNPDDESELFAVFYNLSNTYPTPFIGKTYVATVNKNGVHSSYELTFYPNKKIWGYKTTNGDRQLYSGDYTYDLKSGKLSFSNLYLAGQPATAAELSLDQDPTFNSSANTFTLGGKTFILSGHAINAPFVGKTYAFTYETEDQTTVYRREITLANDGSLSGVNYQNGGEVKRYTGNYTYDATTGAITFSNLRAGDQELTADKLFIGSTPHYDTQADHLVLGGSNFRIASQVPTIQPSNPPAFYGKIYVSSWEVDGKTYKETYQLMAHGSAHYRYYIDGKLAYGFNGRYTYNGSTYAITFSDLLDLDYKIIADKDVANYNNNAQYVPSSNELYLQNGYYSLEN